MKVSAVFLQPAGLGIVSQLTGFQSLLRRFVTLGVGGGVTRYVAEFNSKQERRALERLLQTVFSAFVVTGAISVLACLIFAPQLANLVLADRSLGLLIVLIGIAIPLTAQVGVINRFLQGMLKIREMVVLGIVSSALGVIITIPLIVLGGVTGAVLSIPLSSLFALIIGQFYLQRLVLREQHIHLRLTLPDREMGVKLLRFGGTRGLMALVEYLVLLAIRSLIISRLGAESNGLYQTALAMSNRYLGMIFVAVWAYGMPKVATMLGDPDGISRLQNDILRLLFLALVPLVVLILVFRNIWIPILYSKAFLGAYSLVGWRVVGDMFRGVGFAVGLTIVAKERFGFLIGLNLGGSAIQLASFWMLLPVIGLQAAPISYALTQLSILPITLVGHYLYDRFSYSSRNWGLIGMSGLAVGLTLVLTSSPDANPVLSYLVPLAALGIWALTAVSRRDARRVIQIARGYGVKGKRLLARLVSGGT